MLALVTTRLRRLRRPGDGKTLSRTMKALFRSGVKGYLL
jgi:hypothetical protein